MFTLASIFCPAPQTDQLAAPACLSLLEVLDTGVSEHGEVQAVADELLSSTLSRTASLLREADVRGDADVQAALLALLGPLQDVLNDGRLRRPLFSALPFELLQVNLPGWRACCLLVLTGPVLWCGLQSELVRRSLRSVGPTWRAPWQRLPCCSHAAHLRLPNLHCPAGLRAR